jgi:hypothetical protein
LGDEKVVVARSRERVLEPAGALCAGQSVTGGEVVEGDVFEEVCVGRSDRPTDPPRGDIDVYGEEAGPLAVYCLERRMPSSQQGDQQGLLPTRDRANRADVACPVDTHDASLPERQQ